MLQISDDEFISLRPLWVLERFCGPQLYWETFLAALLAPLARARGYRSRYPQYSDPDAP